MDLQWKKLIKDQWIDTLDETEFLTTCRSQSASMQALNLFLVQHYFYSQHFTRYLCALISNLEEGEDRIELAENLFEETGFIAEDASDVPQLPHSVLYKNMMEQLDVDPEEYSVLPATAELTEHMLACCQNRNPIVGLGALCLGAEAIVPHLYQQIVKGLQRYYPSSEVLLFFHLHIGCDDEHAQTMKKIIEKELCKDPGNQILLQSAAHSTIMARKRFFDAISQVSKTLPIQESNQHANSI